MTSPRPPVRESPDRHADGSGRCTERDPLESDAGETVEVSADPVPEADDASVRRAWEETEAIEGPAPTG